MAAMLDGHAKEFAVGALAVVSLFMVSMIVKKGTPAPIPAPIVEVKQTPRLGADELIAGIVGEEGGTPLDGMELGEDAIKAQHMVEQVSTLVKENPDAAASLVKRWLNRS
jgi:flagellar biosynthesis/type III secretory pathway M-ring protein FliF/YscJ